MTIEPVDYDDTRDPLTQTLACRNTARAMLAVYRYVKECNPSLPKEELYFWVLMSRPSFGEEGAQLTIEDLRQRAKKHPENMTLWRVVLHVVLYEYAHTLKRTPGQPLIADDLLQRFWDDVRDVIPEDL